MLYDSTKVLLRGILDSLESTGNIRWEDHLESAGACSYEMHQMARPLYRAYKADAAAKAPALVAVSERAARAIPHVKSMVRAIRRRDQPGAIASGRSALAQM